MTGHLGDLVEHQTGIDASCTMAQASDFFSRDHDFAAVVDDGRVIGICGKHDIVGKLSGRYGFALLSREPVRKHMRPGAFVLPVDTPLRELLEQALGRLGESFYDDVAVVDEEARLVGLISMHRLVQAQSQLMREQYDLLAIQREQLEVANQDLAYGLAHQQELERQIIAKEKTALVEVLASGIAHELNNKLMPILAHSELLLGEASSAGHTDMVESCRAILAATLDSARIIRQLLQLTRPATAERAVCDFREVVDQSLALVSLRLREKQIELVRDLPSEPIVVSIDGGQIRQVLTNLVLNAMDAMEHATRRTLTIRVDGSSEHARLVIADTGIGMPADVLSRVFDPFFTTKGPNRGTGLGLSVSLSIVRAHEGEMQAQSTLGEGTSFTVLLPRERTDAPAPAPIAEARPARRSEVVVLVVEDDDAVAAAVARILTAKLGCKVTRVANGDEACLALTDSTYDLILSDVRMPGMNGVDLLAWIRKSCPQMVSRMAFMTGDTSDSSLNAALEGSRVPILRKPVTVDGLMTLVFALLDSGGDPARTAGQLTAQPR